MKLVDAYGSRCVPCCDTMREALTRESAFGIPGRSGVFSIGLYTGCDDFSLRPVPMPFVEGSDVGEALDACPWCGEKIEDCFRGSFWDHPCDVKLTGKDAESHCDACTRKVEDAADFKRTIGSNRMQLCPRHYDAFNAWFAVNSREMCGGPGSMSHRVWL